MIKSKILDLVDRKLGKGIFFHFTLGKKLSDNSFSLSLSEKYFYSLVNELKKDNYINEINVSKEYLLPNKKYLSISEDGSSVVYSKDLICHQLYDNLKMSMYEIKEEESEKYSNTDKFIYSYKVNTSLLIYKYFFIEMKIVTYENEVTYEVNFVARNTKVSVNELMKKLKSLNIY